MPNANWSNPTLTSTYTNFVSEVKNRDEDLALQFDGTTSTNLPTNAIRWDSAVGRWKKWNGTSWAELTSTYALTGLSTTGNATIGGALAMTSGSASAPGLCINGNTSTGIFAPSSNAIAITTNGSEVLRFSINNYVRLAANTGGLQFNGDTAAVNALDDYEEGTFTPRVAGVSTAGTGTYSVQTGTYTKIGDRVLFTARIVWSAHTGTGAMRVENLPFTSSATSGNRHALSVHHSNLTSPAGTVIQAQLATSASVIQLEYVATGGGSSGNVTVDTSAELMITGHYAV